ncbi:hypothetical protein TNCT_132911 [Trichonephila clavata]|uniref:Uncharacterized protein n=1 Tax=Trichonephila clavata TaxID=2740835 RepID=A0A8X6JB11_TRICU|nr:hypothetical protein TNCT_132911 [Trichonephila clavata]
MGSGILRFEIGILEPIRARSRVGQMTQLVPNFRRNKRGGQEVICNRLCTRGIWIVCGSASLGKTSSKMSNNPLLGDGAKWVAPPPQNPIQRVLGIGSERTLNPRSLSWIVAQESGRDNKSCVSGEGVGTEGAEATGKDGEGRIVESSRPDGVAADKSRVEETGEEKATRFSRGATP